jgi:hypothetical protein
MSTISTSFSLSGAFPTPPQRPSQTVQSPSSNASSSKPFNAEAVNKEMDNVGQGLWKPILGIAIGAGLIGAGIKHFNPDKAFSALDLALDASGKHIPQWGQTVLTGIEVAGLSLTAGAMTDWGLRERLKHRNKQIEQLQTGKEPETGLFEEKPSSVEAVMARSQKKDFGFNPLANGTLQALPLALVDATIFGGSVILFKQHWKTNALLNCVLPVLGAVGISALTFSQIVPKLQAIQAQRIQESQGTQATQAVSSK